MNYFRADRFGWLSFFLPACLLKYKKKRAKIYVIRFGINKHSQAFLYITFDVSKIRVFLFIQLSMKFRILRIFNMVNTCMWKICAGSIGIYCDFDGNILKSILLRSFAFAQHQIAFILVYMWIKESAALFSAAF